MQNNNEIPGSILLLIFMAVFFTAIYQYIRKVQNRRLRERQRAYIQSFTLPSYCGQKLAEAFPHLDLAQLKEVEQGLKQFFTAYLNSDLHFVSMPSKVVDELWHEFILDTQRYANFCEAAFGQFLHHRPAALMQASETLENEGLRRCWWHTCRAEGIDPAQPVRLPLLFALDAKLGIPKGFHYVVAPVKMPAKNWLERLFDHLEDQAKPDAEKKASTLATVASVATSIALAVVPTSVFADTSMDGTLTGFGPRDKVGCGGCGGCGGGGGGGCGGGGCGGGGCGGCGGE